MVGGELLPALLADGPRDPRPGARPEKARRAPGRRPDHARGPPATRSRSAMRCGGSTPWSIWRRRSATSRAARSRSSTGSPRSGCCARRSAPASSRFVFFSAMGATGFQRTRFFRSKALAEHAVADSPLETTVFAPSIVYRPGDPWITLLQRFAPAGGAGLRHGSTPSTSRSGPRDVARCVAAALDGTGAEPGANGRYELAGPEVLSYDDIVEAGRWRRAAGRGPWCMCRSRWCARAAGARAARSGPRSSPPGRRRS